MENYTWSAFESGIVGNGFGDVGIIGEVAPFGRKFQIWPSAPSAMNTIFLICAGRPPSRARTLLMRRAS